MKHYKSDQGVVAAVARALNLPVSTKQCVEISSNLRYKTTVYAKKFLQDVIVKRRAVSFHRFTQDLGHKAGIGPGRYPQKAAREFLKLITSVEANAQVKGMDTAHLKIVKILANKASIPFTGSRLRRNTKRSHLEVEVRELGQRSEIAKEQTKVQPEKIPLLKEEVIKKEEEKTEVKRIEEKKAEEKKIEVEASLEPKQVDAKKAAASELSSAELLKKAQEKAAQLNKKEKDQKEVSGVAHLYEELQKKGTLRGKP